MNNIPAPFHTVISWVVTLLVPLALLLTATRLLLVPLFVEIEYRTPGFPEDSYGFTQAERIRWSRVAMDYLLNDEGIDFLGDLSFEDGSPLYNQRELSHMVDVKVFVEQGLALWLGILGALLALGVWAWRGGWWGDFRLMLASGGKLTVLLILALSVYLALNFTQLFTQFHRLFFEGDSWLFLFSDTLIRLFPMRFWRDGFTLAAGLTLVGGAALWYFFEYRLKGA